MAPTPPPSTKTLLGVLRRHYVRRQDFPGGIFLPECGLNGTTGRRVDAVHIGFTATSGRILRGHEIKVSRSDWLTELSKVDKASTWAWWTGKGTDPRQFARALQLTEKLGRRWQPQEARRVAADAARVARELEAIAAFVDDGSVS